ncbi:MAG: hypothetical protein H6753_00715 [Candidatus Omnitrophica bacterium]|nr:hypothetical protein [Candidatus Omnitrophota bacterium]
MKIRILMSVVVMIFFQVFYASSQDVIKPTEGFVKVVKDKSGNWQLLVDDQPYFIKGMTYTPVKIGEDPKQLTMRNWMDYDDDHDGQNDFAYQSWLDKNHNNVQDVDEKAIGDFSLMKDLGVNTIRLYHVASNNKIVGDIYKNNPGVALQFAHPVNKDLLRQLYSDYGIRVIMGNFLGSWTIGSGASWDAGTDYANPIHRENIKKSVRAMVLDNKDEPYVLMWLLGNENNMADFSRCNAKTKPREYATLVGELARIVKELDPNHPVAISEGDAGFNEVTLELYSELAPEIDIVAYNSYRGQYGFGDLWAETKKIFDRPMFILEFGTQAYNKNKGEDQDWQDHYTRGAWQDILKHRDSLDGHAGNSIGGVVFDWTDRWYMDGSPAEHNSGTKSWNTPDHTAHDEWWGIMSLGDGTDSLMRQERKVVTYLRSVWRNEK